MTDIKRINVGDRLSDAAIYNGVVYLAGQVADTPTKDIRGQTAEVLATIDRLLAEAGRRIGDWSAVGELVRGDRSGAAVLVCPPAQAAHVLSMPGVAAPAIHESTGDLSIVVWR